MPRLKKTEVYETLWRMANAGHMGEFLRFAEEHVDKLAEGFLLHDPTARTLRDTHLLHEMAWYGRAGYVDALCGLFKKHHIHPSTLLDEEGNSVMHYAVTCPHKAAAGEVMAVLDHHDAVDNLPNVFGTTPFADACAARNIAVAEHYIMDRVKDVNDIPDLLRTPNYFGHNVLQHTLWAGSSPSLRSGRPLSAEMVQQLLKHAEEYGATEPLLSATNARKYNALDSIVWMRRRLQPVSDAMQPSHRTTIGRELASCRAIEHALQEAGAEHGALWQTQEKTPGAVEAYDAHHWRQREEMLDRLRQERYARRQIMPFAERHNDRPEMRTGTGR